MSATHTPEHWYSLNSFGDYVIASGDPADLNIAKVRRREDADRIVACVNACAGIEDPGALRREVARLRLVADALPKTVDGVPICPGMRVWFYAEKSSSQAIDELKVVGWDWPPGLAPDALRWINVTNEHGDSDVVNAACCYSTRVAAEAARNRRWSTDE